MRDVYNDHESHESHEYTRDKVFVLILEFRGLLIFLRFLRFLRELFLRELT